MADNDMPAQADPQPEQKMDIESEITPGPNAVDITPSQDGGVMKEILKEGIGEEFPLPGDEVYVHYVGTLTNGEKFDSSRDRGQQFQFTIGQGLIQVEYVNILPCISV